MSDPAALEKPLQELLQASAKMAEKLRPKMIVEQKGDTSLVTNVDREIELFLRKELLDLTPDAGFYGEEFGHTPPTKAGYWLVDPVDGTSNFAYGQPLWGITVAYVKDGHIQLGAIALPDLGEYYRARADTPAFCNGEPLPLVPPGPILKTELVGNTDSRLRNNKRIPGKVRHIGAFVVEATFTARQRTRAMITGRIKLYDCAAGILICRQAGCEVRHLTGELFDEMNHLDTKPCPPYYMGPKESNFPFGKLD